MGLSTVSQAGPKVRGLLLEEPTGSRSVPNQNIDQEELMDRSVYQARWLLGPLLGLSAVVVAAGLLLG